MLLLLLLPVLLLLAVDVDTEETEIEPPGITDVSDFSDGIGFDGGGLRREAVDLLLTGVRVPTIEFVLF